MFFYLQELLVAIVIILTSLFPAKAENVIVDTSAITAESQKIVCECKNMTGRVINEPEVTKISKKVDGEWQTVYRSGIPDVFVPVLPGRSGTLCSINVERNFGTSTLEPGEYKMTVSYYICEKDGNIKQSIEVPFTV